MSKIKKGNDPLRAAAWFPGQAYGERPNVESVAQNNSHLEKIIWSFDDGLRQVVGIELAADVAKADAQVLKDNTLVAQLVSLRDSSLMWLALLKHSFAGEPYLETLIEDGNTLWQVAGDSFGGYTAGFAVGPGHIDDQLQRLMLAAKGTIVRAAPMLGTPHTYERGGMVAVTKLPAGVVSDLVKDANAEIGQKGFLKLIKYNAPEVNIVAGPREGLNRLGELALARGRKVRDISFYWFHHPMAMELIGRELGIYLSKPESFGTFSPFLTYVSNVTGKITPPDKIAQDLGLGVWKPVRVFTSHGASLHGAAHRNGVYDVFVFSKEPASWLGASNKVTAHLMTDYESMGRAKMWIMDALESKVRVGRPQVSQNQSAPSQQLSRSTLYQAKS